MRVGGKPRVYWLTMTVLPSAVIETLTGSSDLPLLAPSDRACNNRSPAAPALARAALYRTRSIGAHTAPIGASSPSQTSMRIKYASEPGSFPAAGSVNVATSSKASAVMRVMMGPPSRGMLVRPTVISSGQIEANTRVQCCMCKLINSAAGIMLAFKLVMIQSEPATTTVTISMPKASASTLLVLSDPVVMCRKNTRWTPIWAMARTASPSGTPEATAATCWPPRTTSP